MRFGTAEKQEKVGKNREDLVKDLKARDRRFAEEYVAGKFNATAAAIEAGYSKSTADKKAAAWLNPDSDRFKPKVAAYVQALMDEVSKTLKITAEEVLQELTCIARGNIVDVASCDSIEDLKRLPRDVQKAVKSIRRRTIVIAGKKDEEGNPIRETTIEIVMKDDIAANRLLGLYYKLWVERQETTNVTWAERMKERAQKFPHRGAGSAG